MNQTFNDIINTRATEAQPPKMTMRSFANSSQPTAKTEQVAKELAMQATNPFHAAETSSGAIGKLRKFLNKNPHGTSPAVESMMRVAKTLLGKKMGVESTPTI